MRNSAYVLFWFTITGRIYYIKSWITKSTNIIKVTSNTIIDKTTDTVPCQLADNFSTQAKARSIYKGKSLFTYSTITQTLTLNTIGYITEKVYNCTISRITSYNHFFKIICCDCIDWITISIINILSKLIFPCYIFIYFQSILSSCNQVSVIRWYKDSGNIKLCINCLLNVPFGSIILVNINFFCIKTSNNQIIIIICEVDSMVFYISNIRNCLDKIIFSTVVLINLNSIVSIICYC